MRQVFYRKTCKYIKMICSIKNCENRSVIKFLLLRVKFGYCKKHKKYVNRILIKRFRHRNYGKRNRLSVYELEKYYATH